MKIYLELKNGQVQEMTVTDEQAFSYNFTKALLKKNKNIKKIYYIGKSEYYTFGSNVPKYRDEKFYIYGEKDLYKKLANYLTYYGI